MWYVLNSTASVYSLFGMLSANTEVLILIYDHLYDDYKSGLVLLIRHDCVDVHKEFRPKT